MIGKFASWGERVRCIVRRVVSQNSLQYQTPRPEDDIHYIVLVGVMVQMQMQVVAVVVDVAVVIGCHTSR